MAENKPSRVSDTSATSEKKETFARAKFNIVQFYLGRFGVKFAIYPLSRKIYCANVSVGKIHVTSTPMCLECSVSRLFRNKQV